MTSISAAWRERPRLPPLLVDGLLALALSISIVVEGAAAPWRPFNPALLLMTLPLIWRRRQPLIVFGVVVVGAVIAIDAAQLAGFTAVMIAAYSVGAYSKHQLLSLGILVAVATAVVVQFGGGFPPLPYWSGPFIVLLPLWLVGNTIRGWRLRADVLEDKAARLEREQEQVRQAAIAQEQARIARELHDVVAHTVSVMVVQAGAARHIVKTSPEQAGEALLAVEASGREAMAELRRLLGLLQPGDGGAEETPLAPQPGVEQLASLVRRVRDAGLPVELYVEGAARPLAPGVNLTAYRVVQEALTNALKYSGLASTEVILDYRDAMLKVEVLDEGPGHATLGQNGAGRGLVGMRERVALFGGKLEAGPRLERGYAVRAWLPMEGEVVAGAGSI